MPQARHGGIGVDAFAVAGSKFEGTGLENEHIGQTQVALANLAGVDSLVWENGEPVLDRGADWGFEEAFESENEVVECGPRFRVRGASRFEGFG